MDNKIIQHNSLLPIGTILRGIYRIDNYLSRGGFSNTYVATNIEFDEQVAVKEFFVSGMSHRDLDTSGVNVSNLENSDQFNKMRYIFKRDAKRMRRMVCDTKNPHIVRVYDIFEENNTAYYVMEYINGNSLAEMLKRQNAPIDSNWLFEIFLPQMLDAIDVMHKINLWHLDIMPNNIMVEANGNVKLLGFGTHKLIDPNSGDPAAMSSLISPVRLYSPIELKDFDYKKIGPWTDFYSLGATLYNLATQHRPPFSSEIVFGESAFKFLPSTSEKFRKLVMWMMNIRTKNRPQSVDEIISAVYDSQMIEQDHFLLPIGTILRGIYRIDSCLSSNGFSTTYEATNLEFDEHVAIKEFFIKGMSQRDMKGLSINVPDLHNVEEFDSLRNVFKREAKRISRIGRDTGNPHIVRVYDIFEENNTTYYVMEYINGNSLAEMLKQQNAPIDSNWLFETFLPQMLDAIDVMHKKRFYHLDIMPNNIMVEANGNVKLLGFGANKLRASNSNVAVLRSSANRSYNAIELKDCDYNKIGPWTDFYSLGATLYNLATQLQPPLALAITYNGERAFKFSHQTKETFKKLVIWMMNTRVEKRPQSVREIQYFLKNSFIKKQYPEQLGGIVAYKEKEVNENRLVLTERYGREIVTIKKNNNFIEKKDLSAPFIGIVRHRLATDGKGVTTLAAFHSCPLRCKYCLNPQCLNPEMVWRNITTSQLLDELLLDNLYFLATGGGVTFGGGEPLLRSEFIEEFCRIKPAEWKVNVETSLNVDHSHLERVLPYIYQFIIDVKDTDPEIYKKYTTRDNGQVLDNLRWLLEHDGMDEKILVRLPHIPDYNTQADVDRSRALLEKMGIKHFDEFDYFVNPE